MIEKEKGVLKPIVQWIEVTSSHDGQRLDNF